MNILFDTLPTSIEVGDKCIPIKTDFRCWIRFSKIVQEYNLEQIQENEFVEMMEKIISTLFFDKQTIEISLELLIKVTNFYSGFVQQKESKNKNERSFDFEIDADAIYASFLKEYGIRLSGMEMHWYEFRTLFANLSNDTPIGKLMQIRTMKEEDVPKEKRKEFREIKEELMLPVFGSYADDQRALKNLREKLR